MPRSRRKRIRPGLKQRRFRQRLIAYRGARQNRGRRRIPRAAVPSFFTLMNLFCGFLSITQAHDGRFEYAAFLILLAAFFDMLDGMMARLTDGTSLFGVELDSLSDIVSFGAAPSFLIWTFGLGAYGIPGVIVSSLPAVCGAVRLARFNGTFEGEKKEYFTGLPIPVAAMAIVAIILNGQTVPFLVPGEGDLKIIMTFVVLLSGLMVSNIPFDSVPRPSPEYLRKHPVKTVLYVGAIVAFIAFQELAVLVGLAVYLGIGIGRAVRDYVRAVMEAEPDDD